MTEQPPGAHEKQHLPEALGLDGLSEREKVIGVRFFVAARAGNEEAARNLITQEIKPSDKKLRLEGVYNPVLEGISIAERKAYWEKEGSPYEEALEKWHTRFTTLVNRVTDQARIAAFKSILPQNDDLLKAKELKDIDKDDALKLFNEYSNNKSDIDKFMVRAITNLTEQGVLEPEVLQTHINHLRWIATGFFGKETASMIGTQILFEVERKKDAAVVSDFIDENLERVNNLGPEEAEVLRVVRQQAILWEEEKKKQAVGPTPAVQSAQQGDDDFLPAPIEGGTVRPEPTPPPVAEETQTAEGQPAADANPTSTTQNPDEQSTPVVENNPANPPENPQGSNKENVIEYGRGDATNLTEWIKNHLKNQTAPNVTFAVPSDVLKQYLTSIAQGLVKGGSIQVMKNNTILLKGVQIEKKVLFATAKATVDIIITNNPAGDGIQARLQRYYDENGTANTFGARGKIEDQLANINATFKTGLNEQIDPKANPLWSTERILISGDKVHIKFNKPA